ncbi:MAG TPA: hypothetical protein PLL33_11045 [Paracoccus sp. (in: a-proteobacteria)]|nr:hypothetical protein [Paracoccus sp. (in: a-proteobacteria)]
MARRILIVLVLVLGLLALVVAKWGCDLGVAIETMLLDKALLREQLLPPLPMIEADYRAWAIMLRFRITSDRGAAHRQQRGLSLQDRLVSDLEGREQESCLCRADEFAWLPVERLGLQ